MRPVVPFQKALALAIGLLWICPNKREIISGFCLYSRSGEFKKARNFHPGIGQAHECTLIS